MSTSSTLTSRLAIRAVVISAVIAIAALLPQGLVHHVAAQSPGPTARFIDVVPGTNSLPAGYGGVVVEGAEPCNYTERQLEDSTLYFVNLGIPTWTELSLVTEPTCTTTLASEEQEVANLAGYIEANSGSISGTKATDQYWLGVMVDEETGYGYSNSNMKDFSKSVEQTELQSESGVS